MHITVISPYPSSKNQHDKGTGVGSYSMYLVNALALQGNTIDIYAHVDTGLTDETLDSINIYRIWKKSFGGLFALFGRIIRDKPKIVHIQHEVNIFGNELILPFTPLIAGLVRILGGHVTITFHGGMGLREIDKVFIQENGKKLPPWVIKLAFRYIFGLFSLFAHKIIVHEDFQRSQLIDEHHISADKIVVIPHGAPDSPIIHQDARAYFAIPEGKRVFLYMGFAARYKGLPELYTAYSEYIKNHTDVVLLLGMSPAPRLQSDNTYMSWFHDLEQKFQSLGESVKYIGFMNTEKIEYAYSVADRVLFPYSRRLAASGPMAIAIGYQKPIVLSNVMSGEKGSYEFDFEKLLDIATLRESRIWSKIAVKTIEAYKK